MRFINCQQNTPEWHQARVGVITASRYKDACDFLKNGEPTQKNLDYSCEIAIQRISGETTEDTFVTRAMQRGTELEPYARICYESKSGNLALESGIVLTDDGRYGYSSDGFVDDDGLIEIKCLSSSRKLIEIWVNSDLSEYIHQIQGGLWITGRKWCDFVMYAPQLENVGKQLFVKRIERDDDFIEKMELQLWAFEQRVQAHLEILKKEAA